MPYPLAIPAEWILLCLQNVFLKGAKQSPAYRQALLRSF